MQIAERVAVTFVGWIVMMFIAAWILGPERKRRWFRQRDQQKSFLNRRGFLGDFIHFGYPCTLEGMIVFAILMCIILLTAYIAIFMA